MLETAASLEPCDLRTHDARAALRVGRHWGCGSAQCGFDESSPCQNQASQTTDGQKLVGSEWSQEKHRSVCVFDGERTSREHAASGSNRDSSKRRTSTLPRQVYQIGPSLHHRRQDRDFAQASGRSLSCQLCSMLKPLYHVGHGNVLHQFADAAGFSP